MGDSITEGTIRSWEKKVGEAVALDDVVVVIETDKVSVDIRASNSGVLVEQYAAVDDNVEVGAKLLKIDTQAAASAPSSASASSPPAPPTPGNPPPPSDEANPAPPPTDAPPAHRTPLIKFLGKRSLMRKQDSSAQAAAPPPPARSPSLPARHEDSRSTPGVKTFIELPPRFGHPPVTEEEMEAVESGGATL
jgi:pyruvate/2-oxoglutarate dehydrogenase complex dihydrolipoamide acyltransferase (E2) component